MKHLLIPFMLKLDRSLQYLSAHLDGSLGSHVDRIELVQRWTQVFNLKDYTQRSKLPQRVIQASHLHAFMKSVDTVIKGCVGSGQQQASSAS